MTGPKEVWNWSETGLKHLPMHHLGHIAQSGRPFLDSSSEIEIDNVDNHCVIETNLKPITTVPGATFAVSGTDGIGFR